MVSRVTNQTLMTSAQRNLQASMTRLASLQSQASSQKAITKPSDDPSGTGDSLRVRAQQRATEQYSRNVDSGNGWLTMGDSALSATEGILNRVRDLTVQGANEATLTPATREAIASELEGLKSELLGQANTKYQGRSVFAGNSDAGTAFTTDYSYNGAAGSAVQRRIGADSTVRVDADGAAIYGTGGDSAFALIDRVAADLRAGTSVNTHLDAIDDRINTVIAGHAELGTRHAQILKAEESLMTLSGTLEAQRAGVEDVDLSKVLLDLKLQEVSYQTALSVTARVLQPTLMDFLS
jgi:flagellar hook-associated protein 3 FlgL